MLIIVVKFNLPDKEKECIDSVKKYTNLEKHSLLVYDNYPLKENLAVVWNRLIAESTEDIICLLNNDTVVEEGWTKMIEVLDEKVGAVGPVTNNCGGRQKNMERGQIEDINELSGFCYLFRKDVWKEVGRFPEDMPFYGQESIFNQKLQDHGYKLKVDRRVYIHHYKAQSYSKAIKNEEITSAEKEFGAFHYWNYVARLRKLREKVKQGTKIGIYGAGEAFPLSRGANQFMHDFCGKNGYCLQDIETAKSKISELDIFITMQTKVDDSWSLAKEAKALGKKTALYFCDLRSPKQEWPYTIELPEDIKEYFDAIFYCAKGQLDDWDCGVPTYYLPQGTIQHPRPCTGEHYKIVHIGDLDTEYHTGRKSLLEGLEYTNLNEHNREKRLELSRDSFGIYGSSDFSLAVSHDVEGYTSDRLYHILGAGGCALCYNPGGLQFKDKEHLLYWKDPKEIAWLIETDTTEIKKNAFKEVQSKHLYKDRFIEIVTKL